MVTTIDDEAEMWLQSVSNRWGCPATIGSFVDWLQENGRPEWEAVQRATSIEDVLEWFPLKTLVVDGIGRHIVEFPNELCDTQRRCWLKVTAKEGYYFRLQSLLVNARQLVRFWQCRNRNDRFERIDYFPVYPKEGRHRFYSQADAEEDRYLLFNTNSPASINLEVVISASADLTADVEEPVAVDRLF